MDRLVPPESRRDAYFNGLLASNAEAELRLNPSVKRPIGENVGAEKPEPRARVLVCEGGKRGASGGTG